MDSAIAPIRPDVVSVETTPRPTPKPVRVPFAEVLSGGARALVRGAQAAVHALPGSPLMALAVRPGASGSALTAAFTATPEGPGGSAPGALGSAGTVGVGAPGGTTDGAGIDGALAQDQQMNLYYLQIQEEVNAQNRTFTALSNVLEVEHNTAKSAIGNIH